MYKVVHSMDVGRRNYQQDCIFLNGKVLQVDKLSCTAIDKIEGKKVLCAVCDGMGGHSRGEWASRFVCEKLKENLLSLRPAAAEVEGLIEKIQNQIENEMMDNSGTTVAGVALEGSKAVIFNAGDSRVYKITREDISCVSHDHSLVQGLVDSGSISREEAFVHPHKNVIGFGIGDVFKNQWAEGDERVFIREDVLDEDEYYLICTDGVNDVLRDEEIFALLSPNPFDRSCQFAERLKPRLSDNMSFVLIGRDGDGAV